MATAEEGKFMHLLQPIKDLATNWNINIAEDLDEFLDELEHLTFAFEDGPSLNFAEAALLIQGSACVYSKKVEYLHSLVFRALEFLNQKRQQQQQQEDGRPRQRRHAAPDAVVLDNDGFLDIDALIEEGTDVDLDPESTPQALAPVQRPPMLLAFESYGARRGDGDTGVYMVQRCAVHCSGALLLEPSDGDAFDDALLHTTAAAPVAPPQPTGNEPMEGGWVDDVWANDAPVVGGNDDDDDHGDYSYVDVPAVVDAEAPPAPRPTRHAAQRAAAQPQPADAPPDPYAMLDMHDVGPWPQRPYVKKQPRRPAPPTGPAPLQLTLHTPAAAAGALALSDLAPVLRRLQGMLKAEQRAADAAAMAAEEEDVDDGVFGFADDVDAGNDSDGDEIALPDGWDMPPLEDSWAPLPSSDEQSYEELCRSHIEAFINAAAAAQVQSDLAVRVSTWQQKIQPLLEEQDARPAFDIHVYGGQLLDRLEHLSLEQPPKKKQQEPEAVPLEVAFSKCATSYDVSRMFSSMLQLVNNGNVVLDKTGEGSCGVSITLLQLERAQERFEADELLLGGAKSPARKRGKKK